MDNKENKRLSAENQKWLDDLLNTPSSQEVGASELATQFAKPEEAPAAIPEDEQVLLDAKALIAEESSALDIEDDELEKILAEDWLAITREEAEAAEAEAAQEESAHDDTAAKEEAEAPIPPRRFRKILESKRRPKRTDGYGLLGIPHIISTLIWLALIVVIGVSLGRVLWVCCADVMAFGKEPQQVTITITEKDDIGTISKKLGDAHLIRYPGLFEFFAKVTGKDEDISIGTFTLNSQYDYNAMINAMYSYGSRREEVEIMFPEGYNCAQIFKLLEENNVCSAVELEDYAAFGELSEYWFLEGVAREAKYCLEGYMAPDTYKFYTNDSPRRVIEKFLDEFESRFTDKMKEDFQAIQKQYADRLKANGFSSSYVQENSLTLHQVVTLASIIQKETSSDSECFEIASVFYNRLVNPSIQSLGADITVHYALNDYFFEIEELTSEHLNTDSPYNTRKNKGIPPGPICNMGVQALYAALEPYDTNYHYFVFDKAKNAHRFAVTEREHLQNVAELMGG